MTFIKRVYMAVAHLYYWCHDCLLALLPQKPDDASRSAVGMMGEAVAVRFLRLKGWRIIERNWRMGRYELDIVARNGDTLVFVEVKTRKNMALETPAMAMHRGKLRAFLRATQRWRITHQVSDVKSCRCDVVAVTYSLNALQKMIFHVEHYVNIIEE